MQPPVRYAVAAQRIEEEPPAAPPSVLVSEQRLQPGALPVSTLQKRPTDGEAAPESKAAYDVVDAANRAAAQGPDASAYYNAIQEYVYSPGTLYQIYGAPTRVTDIALQPGERIEGQVVIGDLVRWVIGVGKSPSAGELQQQHVYIKPTRPGLHTNLIINTSLRSYFCEIHSYRESYMVAVKWRYPQDEIAQMVASAERQHEGAKSAATISNPADLNFRYSRTVVEGPARWAPTQVFDDGKKTYIHFPKDVTSGEVPVLFVMHNDETQLVNYRAKRDTYIVDRLFDVAELRVGAKSQEVVRIERIFE